MVSIMKSSDTDRFEDAKACLLDVHAENRAKDCSWETVSLLSQGVAAVLLLFAGCFLSSLRSVVVKAASSIYLVIKVRSDGESSISFVDAIATWFKICELAWPEVQFIAWGLTSTLVCTMCEVLRPVMLGNSLDLVSRSFSSAASSQGEEWLQVTRTFFIILVLEAFKSCAEYGRVQCNNNTGDFVRQRAQELYFENVLHFEVAFFDQMHTSELNQRFHYLDDLHYMAGHQIPEILRHSMTVVIASVYMVNCNGFIGIIVIGLLGLQAMLETHLDKLVLDALGRLEEVEKVCHRMREESFAIVRTIKHFSSEDKQTEMYSFQLQKDRVVRKALVHICAVRCGVASILMACVSTSTWYFGLRDVLQGLTSVGEVSAFALLVGTVRDAATEILKMYQETMKRTVHLKQAFDLIERTPAMPSNLGIILNKHQMHGHVELKDVGFHYPSRPEVNVLESVNVILKPGTVTALCGPSGGGKSSIAGLVLRDYDPSHGVVLIDGVDVRMLQINSLHMVTAVVSQEPVLFSMSIEDNIKLGARGSSHEQVVAAAQLANADSFIAQFPKGYATDVGERGARLSGGQKQRIAIARAVLTDPRILVLDEATSALDSESERLVQEALDRVMVGRTTLVIAHRLSTIRSADHIVVVEGGRIAEQGTHGALLACGAAYSRLLELQLTGWKQ